MKRFLAFVVAALLPLAVSAQIKMSLAEPARLDPNDPECIYNPMTDINDNPCAIIKVTTTAPVNGILTLGTKGGTVTLKSEKHADEWWYWVSPLVTNIMFSCEGYTTVPYFGVSLEGNKVYRVSLAVEAAVATVTQFALSECVMKLSVSPEQAVVYYGTTRECTLGSQNITDGIFEVFLEPGTYYYRVEAPYYATATGTYVLSENSREQEVSLKPEYSHLKLSSSPEGAEVTIRGRSIGTTPMEKSAQVRRGKVTLTFTKEDYYIKNVTVDVPGNGEVVTVPTVELAPQFGYVTCICEDPDATLTIESRNKVVATGKSGMRVKLNSSATYKLSSSKPSHIPQEVGIKGASIEGQDIRVSVGKPSPVFGGIMISSKPTRATVFIDGEEVGKTALSQRVLVGEHKVEIALEGYKTDSFTVSIEENGMTKVERVLQKGPMEEIVILQTALGSHILIDGKSLGKGVRLKAVTLKVGQEYVFESDLDNPGSAKYQRQSVRYTPSGIGGQTVVIPEPQVKKQPWLMKPQDDFSSIFLNPLVGFGGDYVSSGFRAGYVKSHIGLHASGLWGLDDKWGLNYAFTAGPLIRLTNDSSRLDFQLFGGLGYGTVSDFYWGDESGLFYEAGFRLAWREDRKFSLYDVSASIIGGCGEFIPTIGLGIGIPSYPVYGLFKLGGNSDREYGFHSEFTNLVVGVIPDYDETVVGLQYAHCATHLGFYVQGLFGTINESVSFSGGPVVRLTNDNAFCDLQLSAGLGYMYEGIGAELGTRFAWRGDGIWSWWDIGAGIQFTHAGEVPYFSVGLGIPLVSLYLLYSIFLGASYY